MQYSRLLEDTLNKFTRIMLTHPPHLVVVAEIQDPFDDIFGVAIGVESFYINIPKKRLPRLKANPFFERFSCFHALDCTIKIA